MKIKTDIAKLLEESLNKYNSMGYIDFFNSEYGIFLGKVVDNFLDSGEFIFHHDSEKINWITLMIIEELSVDIEDVLEDEYDKGYDHGYDSGYADGCADTSYDD